LPVQTPAVGGGPPLRLGQLLFRLALFVRHLPPLRAGANATVRQIVLGVVGPPLAVYVSL
jgi:hypothetical protein